MNNLYRQYCNDIQNEAWGAYCLAIFIQTYNKQCHERANMFHLFTVMPFIVNDSLKRLIMLENYEKQIKLPNSLVRNIIDSSSELGAIQGYILQYQEYTLASLLFAMRVGLIELDETTAEFNVKHEIPVFYDWSFAVAEKLGKIFSKLELSLFYNYIGVYV